MPPHSHLIQNQLQLQLVALTTLGAQSAIIVNTQFSTPTASFLAKRVRYFLQIVGRSTADNGPLIIGCAHGDALATEIESAMNERNVNGPSDVTSVLDQDLPWTVYQTTLRKFEIQGDQTYAQVSSGWMKFPGRNGTPLLEGSGMVVFIYNAGGAGLTTGSVVEGIVQVQGVWLND